jgi:hypothetical protein
VHRDSALLNLAFLDQVRCIKFGDLLGRCKSSSSAFTLPVRDFQLRQKLQTGHRLARRPHWDRAQYHHRLQCARALANEQAPAVSAPPPWMATIRLRLLLFPRVDSLLGVPLIADQVAGQVTRAATRSGQATLEARYRCLDLKADKA